MWGNVGRYGEIWGALRAAPAAGRDVGWGPTTHTPIGWGPTTTDDLYIGWGPTTYRRLVRYRAPCGFGTLSALGAAIRALCPSPGLRHEVMSEGSSESREKL